MRLAKKHQSTLPWPMQLAVPVASLITFGIHLLFSKKAPPLETHSYMLLFWEILGVSIALSIAQSFWTGLRQWMRHMWPIFTAAILLLGLWDVITSGFHLLPLPYFPGPAAVLRSLISDRGLLADSTWHSLVLLLSGYTLGVIVGLVSGVCIGWLLGNATAQSCGADPSHGMDSSCDGSVPFGDYVRSGINRARGVVPGHNVDCVRGFQYPGVVP
jgi:hypothetical protein